MNFHFKLMLIVEGNGKREKKLATEVLRNVEAIDHTIDPDDSTIDFFFEGQSYISPQWNLGRVDWLLPQFQEAFVRLGNQQIAIVRSAVIEGSELPYLIFEPQEETINISLVVFEDYEIEQIFPAGPFAERSADLYQYFQTNRDKIIHSIKDIQRDDPEFKDYFADLKIPAKKFLNELQTIIAEMKQVRIILKK